MNIATLRAFKLEISITAVLIAVFLLDWESECVYSLDIYYSFMSTIPFFRDHGLSLTVCGHIRGKWICLSPLSWRFPPDLDRCLNTAVISGWQP